MNVTSIDVASLIASRVLRRRLPPAASAASSAASSAAAALPPAVVMKADIEGGEFSVVSRLLALGVLCQLSAAVIEYHGEQNPTEPRVVAADEGGGRAGPIRHERRVHGERGGRRLRRRLGAPLGARPGVLRLANLAT